MGSEDPAGPSGGLLKVIVALNREVAGLRAEVAERREQYRALIHNNPYPTWIYCLDSLRFLDVNPAAVLSYGWSRDEFLEMTIADIRPREDVPALVAHVSKMRAIKAGSTGPWRHRHKDGALVEVGVSFQTLPFAGKSARLVVANEATTRGHVEDGPSVTAEAFRELSPREREVFRLVATGLTSEQVAGRLGVSGKSVETYRARFLQKLGIKTRADIIRCALAWGILARKQPP